jgi:integrase
MLKAGESETTVAAHLGHASVAMIRKHYGHFIPETKPSWALDRMDNVVDLKTRMKDGGK